MKWTIRFTAAALACAAACAHAQGAAPVDTCKLLSKPDAEALVGALSAQPEAEAAQGSLLGMCTWAGAKGRFSVAARPAAEFDDTIRSLQRRKKQADAVPGLGAKAYQTRSGLMVQPQGKPYFLQVLAFKGAKRDAGLAVEGARKLGL